VEIEGHPTHDLVEELERRGAVQVTGGSSGPRVDAIRFVTERLGDVDGRWLFLPAETYQTGFDEIPP
jgi:hypothetical protein